MSSPESFVSQLEGRNQTSFERLIAQLDELATGLNLGITDLLRLEARATVEASDAAAMWLIDTESLPFKMALASYCGACAQRYAFIEDRLRALDVPVADFDPLALGYSKLFAHFRSLQSTAERAAAGSLTAGAYAVARQRWMAGRAEGIGDMESARLLGVTLPDTEREHMHSARVALLAAAHNEESQARARRAAFRAVELLGDVQDVGLFKKFLSRSLKKNA